MTDLEALKIQHALANDMIAALESAGDLTEAAQVQLRVAERERNRLATLIEAHEHPDLVAVLNRIGRKTQLMQMNSADPAVRGDAHEIGLLAGIALKMVEAGE